MATGVTSSSALVEAVRAGLRAVAEPERAPASQAYLKTSEPMLGVRLPAVRAVVRAHPPADLDTLLAAAARLWREASAREERYAAAMTLDTPPGRGRVGLLPLVEEFVVAGAWWDLVDATTPVLGPLLISSPEVVGARVRAWAVADDVWLRRAAICAQLDLRSETDVALLSEVIEANVEVPEFFVRKAIGWALRQYAKADPAWVRRFVADHPSLSPLSRREALKHL